MGKGGRNPFMKSVTTSGVVVCVFYGEKNQKVKTIFVPEPTANASAAAD